MYWEKVLKYGSSNLKKIAESRLVEVNYFVKYYGIEVKAK
jgi:hypothetical protein